MIKLFVFDMDGVIFEGHNFWLDMHSAYDTKESGHSFFRNNADVEYQKLFDLMAKKFWLGVETTAFLKLLKSRTYVNGIHALCRYLKERNITTAIITTGPFELAERAKEDLDIDYVFSNRLYYDSEGRFNGESKVEVDNNNKFSRLSTLLAKLNISIDEVCSVGDSENDIRIAQQVDCSFAYNSDCEELKNVSKFEIVEGRIFDIASLMEEERVKRQKRC